MNEGGTQENSDMLVEIKDEDKDGRMAKINEIIEKVNQILDTNFDSSGIIIADCRDKKLKNTKSWSSNIFIKFHHALKKDKSEKSMKSPQEFCHSINADQFGRIEASGFLTIIDETPCAPK